MWWQYWWDLLRLLLLGLWVAVKEVDFFQWALRRRDRQMNKAISLCKDKSGETCIITGGNSSIGLETAAILASVGYHVILACRSKERANEAINEIVVRNKKQSKPHSLEFLQLDVSSIDSVRDFVNEVKRKNYKITLLINNAGVMFVPETYSKDGIEMHFAANYLGHFLLTYLLLPTLIMNGPSRVIYVTSDTFQFAKPLTDPSNLTKPKKYSRFEAYATSKLCIQLAVVELVERLRRANLQNKLSVWTVHPGAVSTKIGREFPPVVNWLWNLVDILFPFFLKSPKEVVPF
jgi:NAD(P)-dependent dehydrogenase (short-subunit alcohol dehydrogenase family)